MKRNKEWLIKRVENYIPLNDKTVGHVVDNILDIIYQLDEPETVENLLVPKQELPVIPKFVAEWIVQAKKWGYSISDSIGHATFYGDTTQHDKAMRWSKNNQDIFARAWLDGYTVKEEQKFYVYLGDGQYLVSEDDLKESYVEIRHQEDRGFLNYNMTFTEQEIKGYDRRY